MLVCTLGDLTLDVVVRLGARFVPGDDTPATSHLSAGGQAANVAAWSAACGAEARLIATRGTDAAGQIAAREIERRGVELCGATGPRGGIIVSVSAASDERSMLTDRGSSPELRPEEIDVGWLRGCDRFHLSGYALLGGPIAEAGARAAGAARAQGAAISVDLASAAGIEAFGAERVVARLRQLEPDILFATDSELAALGSEPAATTTVVKHGPGGVTVVREGERETHDAPSVEVVDPTGAGDALAAGFLVGGIEMGLDTAARCLGTPGAMP